MNHSPVEPTESPDPGRDRALPEGGQRARKRLILLATLILLLLSAALPLTRAAVAQQPPAFTLVQDTVAHFGQPCAVRSNISVSDAAGGELRLAATLEDYFTGTAVDTARWRAGSVYSWYIQPPSVANGVLTLDSAWLLSQANFQPTQPRFFEARAQQRSTSGNAGWPDLGFYREQPPLYYTSGFPADSAMRIFITRDDNSAYVRARDGDGNSPLYDVNIPTVDLTQYRTFRIEWEATQTRFYVDGTLVATTPGGTTLNTWAFLYQQTPQTYGASPMRIDWVRAGQYAPSGSYTSCTLDAGQHADWRTAAWEGSSAGGSVQLATRSSTDGVNWSAWAAVSGGQVASPDGRYLQYRVDVVRGGVFTSPEVGRISFGYDASSQPPPDSGNNQTNEAPMEAASVALGSAPQAVTELTVDGALVTATVEDADRYGGHELRIAREYLNTLPAGLVRIAGPFEVGIRQLSASEARPVGGRYTVQVDYGATGWSGAAALYAFDPHSGDWHQVAAAEPGRAAVGVAFEQPAVLVLGVSVDLLPQRVYLPVVGQ